MSVENNGIQVDIDLKAVLEGGLVGTRFQPIISMREKAVIGVEALSFGLDPNQGGVIPPLPLFQEAQSRGLTLELDRVCREKALAAFAERFGRDSDLLLWLNLETSILSEQVVGNGRLLGAVREQGLFPHQIVIEIVESHLPEVSSLQRFVEIYKGYGFYVALDDVGTGHSNLERIARIKPDIIKIDRSLVHDLGREHYRYEVVRSLRNLAQGIGALVLAEGLETEDEALAVLELGINLHQGYYYGRPEEYAAGYRPARADKMAALAQRFQTRRMERFAQRQEYYNLIGAGVQAIINDLKRVVSGGTEETLAKAVQQDQNLECLYILGLDGVQVSDTVCNYVKLLRPKSLLFRPAHRGADLSLKDYFLLIKAGLARYVSDPYISQASGNLCVTISTRFSSPDGRDFILCADYDCEEQLGSAC
jgi:EAL domain-containing protein (putative c-di-GMP-specific phosphodiesterase class I)